MIKLIISYLNIIRFSPHVIIYLFFRKNLQLDMNRCVEHGHIYCNGIKGLLYLLTFDKSFRALFYFRIGYFSYLIKFLAPTYSTLLINSHCEIGKSALLVHAFSTIINPKSIGENFRVSNNCTIGNSKNGKPIIKDNVTIHPGSIIFGSIIIGNNVIIGAGSLVSKSVPDNCTVIGNPAYIIRRNGIVVCEEL